MGINKSSRTVIHAAIFSFYAYALYYDVYTLTAIMPHRTNYGGRYKYLTQWNFMIQTCFFGLCCLHDFLNVDNESKLHNFLDLLFSVIVFPLGLFVVVIFWGLWIVDRELIYPSVLDEIIPQWMNHAWHTFVLPFIVIENFIVFHQYPRPKSGILALASLAGVYEIWLLWVKHHAGHWTYPFFEVLSTPQIIGFFVICNIIMISFYLLGEAITGIIWGKKRKSL